MDTALCAKLLTETKFTFTTNKLDQAIRVWTRANHPDKGGSTEIYQNVQNCIASMKSNPAFKQAVMRGQLRNQLLVESQVRYYMLVIYESVFNSVFLTGKILLLLFGTLLYTYMLQLLMTCLFELAMRLLTNSGLPLWVSNKIAAFEAANKRAQNRWKSRTTTKRKKSRGRGSRSHKKANSSVTPLQIATTELLGNKLEAHRGESLRTASRTASRKASQKVSRTRSRLRT